MEQMIAKEEARARIAELVVRFREQHAAYKRSEYSEALVRKDFIDPFFKALGWDMDNAQGFAEAYREVIHEDKVKVQKSLKAPDYSFRLPGGKRLFFVEAKKPFVKVKSEIEPAYQVRRYAWSAKLPVSILTDFEEFSVYDCTKRPSPDDSATMARVKYITYEQYETEFDLIWGTFSKEQVLKGSFDKFIASDRNKRGTSSVDRAFLESLDEWRKYLATNISINNPALVEEELNHSVQQTIDRLIFLRIAEDWGVEEYGRMKDAIAEGGDIYRNLFSQFHKADNKYNSGLFDFRKDKVSATLKVDAKVIKRIIEELYYPKCPYEFSVISVEIMGSAYEQFLGKRIVIGKGHVARIEEKPEVRKAGGVYYTPQYIVDHIVERTVGELVKGKTPDQVAKLRILDPACGSGSFLLGAYQYLLNWHKDYYKALKKPVKGRKDDVLRPDGELTGAIKKSILLNNIHGVDLDANAVEVTKLSLLLKCMEGETNASIQHSLDFLHERVLPTLDKNVLCGNSLIEPDIYSMGIPVEKHMRPFDWHSAFEKVFSRERAEPITGQQAIKTHLAKAAYMLNELNSEGKRILDRYGKDPSIASEPSAAYGHNGGFDAVIGNPPYVRSQFIDEGSKLYYAQRYEVVRYQPDTFALFIVQGIRKLRDGGRLGFIVPNGILTNTYYASLRHHMLTQTAVQSVVDLKDGVFDSASVDTSIFVLERSHSPVPKKHKVLIGECRAKETLEVVTPTNAVQQSKFLRLDGHVFNTRASESSMGLLDKIRNAGKPLEEVAVVKNGMKVRKELLSGSKKDERYKRFVVGGNIERFAIRPSERWVCYDRKLEAKYTNQAFRDEAIFTAAEKLLVRQVYGIAGIHCAVDRSKLYCDQTCYVLLPAHGSSDLDHLAGLIGSTLLRYYFDRTMSDRKATFPKIKGDQLKQLPIALGTPKQRAVIGDLSMQLSNVSDELRSAKVPQRAEEARHRIVHLLRSLNQEVFALYGLTDEEIAVVEAGTSTT